MSGKHHHHASGNIRTAFLLNLGFTILEIIGGLLTNSVAILSDAIHDLGDSISLGTAWFLEGYAQKGRSASFSYGYRRFSLLGALVNSLILIVGSLFILAEAIPRLMNPEHSHAPGMIGFAIIGIIVNGWAVLRLKDDRTLNARVVAWHLLEDVLGWVAILIVGITLLFRDIHILDPILSVLITLYVLFNVLKNLKKTLTLFLQGAPEEVSVSAIEQKLLSVAGVKSIHHTHIWSLDGERHVLSTHLVVDSQVSKSDFVRIKSQCKEMLRDLQLQHITVEVEYEDEDCFMREREC